MAAHVYLKNEFTEDKKCQNLMSWLVWSCNFCWDKLWEKNGKVLVELNRNSERKKAMIEIVQYLLVLRIFRWYQNFDGDPLPALRPRRELNLVHRPNQSGYDSYDVLKYACVVEYVKILARPESTWLYEPESSSFMARKRNIMTIIDMIQNEPAHEIMVLIA